MARLLALVAGTAVLSTVAAGLADRNALTAPPPAPTAPVHDLAGRAPSGTSPLPLTQYHFAYTDIPYQVNPYPVGRGPQTGYNICNSTTEGDKAQCQTLIANDLKDFCLWGSADPNELIGNVEAAVVAYCTQKGHGSRLIPAGKITGAQFMRTSAYIQITGHIDQTSLNLTPNDGGGELDPHGADLMGNPLGGLVYSSGLPSGDNKTLTQVIEWNNFVGSGIFCLKLCDPGVTKPNYCENRYDLIGCAYNMPASYKDNEFTSCEGDLQDVVGVYTSNGQTYTWSQPEQVPATLPWQPRIPASSNCRTYASTDLFGVASSTTVSSSASSSATSGSSSSRTTGSGSASSASRTSSSASASATGNNNGVVRQSVSKGALVLVVVALFALV